MPDLDYIIDYIIITIYDVTTTYQCIHAPIFLGLFIAFMFKPEWNFLVTDDFEDDDDHEFGEFNELEEFG
ncbi:hypothetical protein BJX61DRAFT_541606 [Aspergillus egyptiacus]|nr:hypothetical protein BJX61DRAFT_541606 [Aspergillus egyptiacus]